MSMPFNTLRAASAGLLSCCLLVTAATAADTAATPDPRVELAAKMPGGVKPDDLRATPVPGIYELQQGSDIGYVSVDGHYFFGGDLFDVQTHANLSDLRRSELRRKLLAGIVEKETLVFGPHDAKYTITVFTDTDCPYCQKLHNDVQELNSLGIRVRYLFYPRQGPGSDSWKVAEAIWCSGDRNAALTRAKKGEEVKARECGANPVVARDYELGQRLGVRGTPGIFTANGDYLPGYMPPRQLLAQLQTLDSRKR